MKVPLLDLKPQNAALRNELDAAFLRVLDSGQFILGTEVTSFQEACAKIAGAKHAIGVSSGTDAILLILMTLGIGPGDEVICPSYTFFSTAGCIARVGAKPVFADSCEVCFNIDAEDAAAKITPRTKALLPVHLFGQAAEMDGVMALAAKHHLPVIEDAAQAFGAEYNGRPLGSIGTMGLFSFFPSKNLGGFGDAGLVVTNDDALAEKARLLRTHGAKPKYFHKMVGANFRIDPLQSALLGVKLPFLRQYSGQRAANAAYYTERLGALPGSTAFASPACEHKRRARNPETRIVLPGVHARRSHIWNQYTVRIPAHSGWRGAGSPRDALRECLAKRGIGSEIYYPRPLHRQECFLEAGKPHASLPACEQLAEEALSIPVYPELRREELDYVISAIGDFLKG